MRDYSSENTGTAMRPALRLFIPHERLGPDVPRLCYGELAPSLSLNVGRRSIYPDNTLQLLLPYTRSGECST